MQAIWRVLEISLAILCSGVVSAVIMPQTTSAAMRNALYVRFGLFAAFVLDSLRGVGGRERFESSNVAFAAQAVGLETMRAASAFEDPHMRLRSGRLIRLNNEFPPPTARTPARAGLHPGAGSVRTVPGGNHRAARGDPWPRRHRP